MGEGEGGMIWENSWNMYITICEIDDQSKFSAWNKVLIAGTLGQSRGMGWGARWDGGSGQAGVGEHAYTHGWFMPTYGKNHHNIVISLQLKLVN